MVGAAPDETGSSDDPGRGNAGPFRDAEEWLDEQGIERRPIQIEPSSSEEGPDRGSGSPGGRGRGSPPPPDDPRAAGRGSDAEAAGSRASGRQQDGPSAQQDEGDAAQPGGAARGRLEDEVAEAVAFVRRSTARSPQSERRLADKMADKGFSDIVVETALERSRDQGLVDDDALAASFVDERRREGHARSRIGRDLRKRGFDSATIEEALSAIDDRDEEAAALDLALERAGRMDDEDAETTFRRVVGYLARRGYAEGLSRRVARKAVFDG